MASLNPPPSLCVVPGRGREADSRNPSSSLAECTLRLCEETLSSSRRVVRRRRRRDNIFSLHQESKEARRPSLPPPSLWRRKWCSAKAAAKGVNVWETMRRGKDGERERRGVLLHGSAKKNFSFFLPSRSAAFFFFPVPKSFSLHECTYRGGL